MYVGARFVAKHLRNVVGGKMTIDAFEQITNIISNIGILLVYILLACIAWKTYKWTSEWSKKIRHGSPVEGRCYYNFENHDGTTIEYNLPCSIIPDIDIDIETKTVTRAKVFRESNTRFNIAKADPNNIKKLGNSIWVYYHMPRQTISMFLHWKEVTRFEVWYENKWQELKPYQGEAEGS